MLQHDVLIHRYLYIADFSQLSLAFLQTAHPYGINTVIIAFSPNFQDCVKMQFYNIKSAEAD
jgi:hypothetical protein